MSYQEERGGSSPAGTYERIFSKNVTSAGTRPVHPWLRRLSVSFVSGPTTALLDAALPRLMERFRFHGHAVQASPDDRTDLVLTTAPFGKSIDWRESVLFAGRRRFSLSRTPSVCTLIHVTPGDLQERLAYFAGVLAKEPPDPADYAFPGLAPEAHRTLAEQGRRGGPMMALERLLQAQAKSIRIILLVGNSHPIEAYHFDLVGAFPRTTADDPDAFYDDVTLRLVTSVSSGEVAEHETAGEPVPHALWESLAAPAAMIAAGQELGKRSFFTRMVRIAELVHVPALANTVASQYSEGCFATWDPALCALVATITGSARPVEKAGITDDDLAVIAGARPDGRGVVVRPVEGKRNDPASSEALEMTAMDAALPRVTLGPEWGGAAGARVPVIRSKLHGHRGVGRYDATRVEFVPLDPPYYHYPVSCATEAQSRAIAAAFARSAALRDPEDPRSVAFTVLPGHGLVMAEKWIAGKAPFQTCWEFMDTGYIQVENHIPQGLMEYVRGGAGLMILRSG